MGQEVKTMPAHGWNYAMLLKGCYIAAIWNLRHWKSSINIHLLNCNHTCLIAKGSYNDKVHHLFDTSELRNSSTSSQGFATKTLSTSAWCHQTWPANLHWNDEKNTNSLAHFALQSFPKGNLTTPSTCTTCCFCKEINPETPGFSIGSVRFGCPFSRPRARKSRIKEGSIAMILK